MGTTVIEREKQEKMKLKMQKQMLRCMHTVQHNAITYGGID